VAIPADRGRCGVVERYVHMATEAAWPRQSSDGRLRESKLGLFDYMLKLFDLKGRLPGATPQRLVRVAPVLAYDANAVAHLR